MTRGVRNWARNRLPLVVYRKVRWRRLQRRRGGDLFGNYDKHRPCGVARTVTFASTRLLLASFLRPTADLCCLICLTFCFSRSQDYAEFAKKPEKRIKKRKVEQPEGARVRPEHRPRPGSTSFRRIHVRRRRVFVWDCANNACRCDTNLRASARFWVPSTKTPSVGVVLVMSVGNM